MNRISSTLVVLASTWSLAGCNAGLAGIFAASSDSTDSTNTSPSVAESEAV